MIIRKFIKEDLSQVLELCREVRQHHIDILDGYFTEQNDEFEQLVFLQSIEMPVGVYGEGVDVNDGYHITGNIEHSFIISHTYLHISREGIS